MTRIFSLFAALIMIGCSKSGDQAVYRITAPETMEPGKPATVSVAGAFSGSETIFWNATAGKFNGSVDGIRATFVAPDNGPVTLVCTIRRPSEKPVVVEAEVQVSGSTSASLPQISPPTSSSGTTAANALNIDDAGFVPSGWMGDVGALKVDIASKERPHSAPYCQKWSFSPKAGGAGWAAVAWQYPENNWGSQSGKDFTGRGFREVSVWARGVKDQFGNFPKVQFKAGGATNPAEPKKASFEVTGDFVTLGEDWKHFTLDLRGRDLSQVIAAFVVVLRAQDVGPSGATFYLDDIEYR